MLNISGFKGLGGGIAGSKVSFGSRGPRFDSCSLQTFLIEPDVPKFVHRIT